MEDTAKLQLEKKKFSVACMGAVLEFAEIPGADNIEQATVVCGWLGKWRGIVMKGEFKKGDMCAVFLPDAILPPSRRYDFMERYGWRVRIQRFRGVESECLILRPWFFLSGKSVGDCLMDELGVTKYEKVVPADMRGVMKGDFPSFVPKTDEIHYHQWLELPDCERFNNIGFYVTEKLDGTSTTAYKYRGEFGVCSRNQELVENERNCYWAVALKYGLREKLPEGYAIQWETCGPGINKNCLGLKELDGFAFDIYDIEKREYVSFSIFKKMCRQMGFPMVRVLHESNRMKVFLKRGKVMMGKIIELAGGKYENGKPREGVVVRSRTRLMSGRMSFKVINVDYE